MTRRAPFHGLSVTEARETVVIPFEFNLYQALNFYTRTLNYEDPKLMRYQPFNGARRNGENHSKAIREAVRLLEESGLEQRAEATAAYRRYAELGDMEGSMN